MRLFLFRLLKYFEELRVNKHLQGSTSEKPKVLEKRKRRKNKAILERDDSKGLMNKDLALFTPAYMVDRRLPEKEEQKISSAAGVAVLEDSKDCGCKCDEGSLPLIILNPQTATVDLKYENGRLAEEESIYVQSLYDTYVLEENSGGIPYYSYRISRGMLRDIADGFLSRLAPLVQIFDSYLLFQKMKLMALENWVQVCMFHSY
jgi:hypothetical protein